MEELPVTEANYPKYVIFIGGKNQLVCKAKEVVGLRLVATGNSYSVAVSKQDGGTATKTFFVDVDRINDPQHSKEVQRMAQNCYWAIMEQLERNGVEVIK